MSTTLIISSFAAIPAIFLLLRAAFGSHPLDKVPGPKPSSLWLGSILDVFGLDAREYHLKLAEDFGSTFSFKSFPGTRQVYTYDPMAMHQILVKEHTDVFEETAITFEISKYLFGGGILGVSGNQHRKQRKMLTPVFSIAHMREMLPIFYEVVHKLESALIAKVQTGPQEIDMLSWMSRTALELVGQAGLGYSFDKLEDEATAHPYVTGMKRVGVLINRNIIFFGLFSSWVQRNGTPFVRNMGEWLCMRISKDFYEGRQITDYTWALAKEIFEDKRRNGTDGMGEKLAGKDIISVLIKENAKAVDEDRLEDDEVIAQMGTLIFAGTDTTSSALSRILHLLSTYTEAQTKLREEIDKVFDDEGEDIPYDQLVSLPYLDSICRETLRLYPPVHLIQRTAYKDATIPLLTPITGTDGAVMTELFIPRNTDISISILNSNRNKKLWGEDADEWKPERWLTPLPNEIMDAKIPGVYSHLMTFNGGGRSCIGFKFSQLEMKVVLAILIHRFEFSHGEKQINWDSSFIERPLVKDVSELPLIVKLAQQS